MTLAAVRKYFLSYNIKLPYDLKIDCEKFKETDLNGVKSIWSECKEFIPEESYTTLVSNLLKDLIRINCCAVSGEPSSPCSLAKLAGHSPIKNLPQRFYFSFRLGGIKMMTVANAASITPKVY